MSDVGVAAPEINAGQQLMELYQDVWRTEVRLKRLVSLDPAFGLKQSVSEFQLNREASEELNPDELAEIGKNGLWAYFNAEARDNDRERVALKKTEAEAAVSSLVKVLAGRSVTVEALEIGDKPISIHSNDIDRGPRSKHLITATGILIPSSTERHGWMGFTANTLVLKRPRRGMIGRLNHYEVDMRHFGTAEPRVALTIE